MNESQYQYAYERQKELRYFFLGVFPTRWIGDFGIEQSEIDSCGADLEGMKSQLIAEKLYPGDVL
jgi:hypothetical protein